MSGKLLLCVFTVAVLIQFGSSSTIKQGDVESEVVQKREVDGILEFDIDENEKGQLQTINNVPNKKKQGFIESLLNKFISVKHKPHITVHNPLKKPIEELHEYLKPKPAPTVTKTKIVKLVTTRIVTQHPICVASVNLKPACSAVNGNVISYKDNSEHISREDVVEKVQKILSDVEIKPSAVVSFPDDLATVIQDSKPEARTGRFLNFGQKTPSIDNVKSGINEQSIEEEEEEDEDEGRFLYKGSTKIVTKTIWATKVQTVTDFKVTATLVPENCVPFDLYFPQCSIAPTIIHSNPLLWKEAEGHPN